MDAELEFCCEDCGACDLVSAVFEMADGVPRIYCLIRSITRI